MAEKKTGISRELLIHPGETIADVLEERGISQLELAASTGVSAAYVSSVIAGKKDISAKFAFALEYVLGVPKSFWLNLQANYDAELLEYNELNTITDEERHAREALKEVVNYLRDLSKIPTNEKKEASIISLRKELRVSNLVNLKDVIPLGEFRITGSKQLNPYVLGAWIRLCQISGESRTVAGKYNPFKVKDLVRKIKSEMMGNKTDAVDRLKTVFSEYGIDFSVGKSFKAAPVQGYVAPKADGSYQMVITDKDSTEDNFWFSLFHELGHIVNGDVGRRNKFLDYGLDKEKETAADDFAKNCLFNAHDYEAFVDGNSFQIESIKRFAKTQNVLPYIVIGILQKEKRIDLKEFEEYLISENEKND